jgi:hypothetical protein
MKTYHEIANIFPLMPEAEITDLANDIKANGLRQPIIIYQEQILDGRNRYVACNQAGVEPIYTEYTGSNAASYVLSLNLQRRHLTPSQKATVATDVEPFLAEEAKKTQGTRNDLKQLCGKITTKSENSRARDKAGAIVGVSGKYVQEAKKIKKEAPELFEQVKAGKKTIKQAKNDIYRQKEAVKKDTTTVEITPDYGTYHNMDILDAPIKDNSLDIIITDPPYPREYLPCWNKLAEFAAKKLVDGGVLIALSGHSYLPEVYAAMTVPGLNYYWTGCIYQPGMSAELNVKRLRTNWKPFLIYVKGEYKRTFQSSDTYVSEYRDTAKGQEYHKWGQNLEVFKQLVNDYTYAKDVICDPFMGGGTTAMACKMNKRNNFIGIEIDKKVFATAMARIEEVI